MDNENRKQERKCQGKYEDYLYFGCQYNPKEKYADFRVFAPRAKSVSVVGDFNMWNDTTSVMNNDGGVWHVKVNGVLENQAYKFRITAEDGRVLMKSDPFAFHSETSGRTASKITDLTKIVINDGEYQKGKINHFCIDKPLNIYEAHIGSWRKYQDNNFFSYRKFADEMSEYLVDMHYTHIELMGIAEYPFDGSWGYQVTGYFAPTSRYGLPEDFAYMVEKFHKAGIGVLLDWVPGHFPKDENGLADFDGYPLYEPWDPLRKEHKEWGTYCFDYENGYVKNFLISNARYWVDVFHIDGLRVDAVASMLYLDYGRSEWSPNQYGGHENLGAIAFFKELNKFILTEFPSTIMIAEESTAFPLVTRPPEMGGLGFTYKWNMGWMNDTLRYVKTDPLFRRYNHSYLTHTLTYAFSENYILPISHDEVVHGKGSLLDKMPGSYEFKFAGLRNYLMYMFTHPGKKLTFMGYEFGQFNEWAYQKELDWNLLSFAKHKEIQDFTRELNSIYLSHSELFELEVDWRGFEWLVVDDCNQNIFVIERRNSKGDKLILVANFSPVDYKNYRFGCSQGTYTVILASDWSGFNMGGGNVPAERVFSHGKEFSLLVDVPPMSGIFYYKKADTEISGAEINAKEISGAEMTAKQKGIRQNKRK